MGLGKVVNTTAASSDCWRSSSFRMRCCALQGRSLKESGIACCEGKPEAGKSLGSAVAEDLGLFAVVDVCELGPAAERRDDPGVVVAIGSFFFATAGEGVSTNMMEGPDTSSDATAVRGVGLDVNLGKEPCCMDGGLIDDLTREEVDSCETELAALRGCLLLRARGMAVSEATAPKCGFSGVTERDVDRSSLNELSFGDPFQIAFLRSSLFEKKELPVVV